jgi:hypothetical protein
MPLSRKHPRRSRDAPKVELPVEQHLLDAAAILADSATDRGKHEVRLLISGGAQLVHSTVRARNSLLIPCSVQSSATILACKSLLGNGLDVKFP